jgi:hypothetical protein
MNLTPAVSNARRTSQLYAALADCETSMTAANDLATRLPSTSFLLLRLFCPLPLAEAYSGATAVLVDELDAGHFYSDSYLNSEFFGYRLPA